MPTHKSFRTRTGQTGTDAYVNEMSAIANAHRELQARYDRLVAAMDAELPADASYPVRVSDDLTLDLDLRHTARIWSHPGDADRMLRYLLAHTSGTPADDRNDR